MDILISVLNFVIPCWVVNMALNILYPLQVLYPGLKKYNLPLDFGVRMGGQRLLGESTTFLGIPIALLAGAICGWLQENILLGLFVAFCVYLGHAAGSFIKRRLGYGDGEYLPVVDHGDYVIATGIAFLVLGLESSLIIFVGILLTLALHPAATYLVYKLGLRKYPK